MKKVYKAAQSQHRFTTTRSINPLRMSTHKTQKLAEIVNLIPDLVSILYPLNLNSDERERLRLKHSILQITLQSTGG